MADATCGHLHQYLSAFRFIDVDLFDFHGGVVLIEHCGFHVTSNNINGLALFLLGKTGWCDQKCDHWTRETPASSFQQPLSCLLQTQCCTAQTRLWCDVRLSAWRPVRECLPSPCSELLSA